MHGLAEAREVWRGLAIAGEGARAGAHVAISAVNRGAALGLIHNGGTCVRADTPIVPSMNARSPAPRRRAEGGGVWRRRCKDPRAHSARRVGRYALELQPVAAPTLESDLRRYGGSVVVVSCPDDRPSLVGARSPRG